MSKKKKGRPEKVEVKASKPHRRRGGWVSGYWRERVRKAFRNREYSRNQRRIKEEIEKRGTRKQEKAKLKQLKRERKQARKEARKQKKKSTQTTFGPPRERPARKSILKRI